MALDYTIGDALGDAGLYWKDGSGALIDFSSGYTFSLTILDGDGTPWFSAKTSGITGAAGSLTTPTPNVTIAWATSGELTAITKPGTYPLRLVATRTADEKTRTFRSTITLTA